MRNQKVRMHTTHPAGTSPDHKPVAKETPLTTWFEHDHERDGTPKCWDCAYVEFHLDDADDEWGEVRPLVPRG